MQSTIPQIYLAPMAGLSDAPMRQMVAQFGVDAVVSEMIASQELASGRPGVEDKALRGMVPPNTKFVVQIAGRDPDLVAKTAIFAKDMGAEQIDINMGCPAKKVTSGQTAGAALLKEPELLLRIIDAAANAVNLPVTVKTRLGWDAHTTYEIAPKMVDAGAQLLTIHGRTRSQKYTGQADHKAIAKVKTAVDVPVIANGDIHCEDTARLALLNSKADGVMIGRAAVGQPWLLAQIKESFEGRRFELKSSLTEIVQTHYDLILSHYGIELGVRAARKHFNAYFAQSPKALRQEILTHKDPQIVQSLIMDCSDQMEVAC